MNGPAVFSSVAVTWFLIIHDESFQGAKRCHSRHRDISKSVLCQLFCLRFNLPIVPRYGFRIVARDVTCYCRVSHRVLQGAGHCVSQILEAES
jgi:hypothetical protein